MRSDSPKKHVRIAAILCTLVMAVMSSVVVSAAPIAQGGGSNFAVFDLGSYDPLNTNIPDYGNPPGWYSPELSLKPTVGLLQLNQASVDAKLQGMHASGQTELAIPLWFGPLTIDPNGDGVWGHVVDSTGYALRTQQQSNLVHVLTQATQLGFKRVIIRFLPQGGAAPETWTGTWTFQDPNNPNEQKYQQNWNFIANTINLVRSTLTGSATTYLVDLSGELGGGTLGLQPQYGQRLWADYIYVYGNNNSLGFSIAYAPGRISSTYSWYTTYGAYVPAVWAFDVYGFAYGANEYSELQAIKNELQGLGLQNSPLIILESFWNDSSSAANFTKAKNKLGLTFQSIFDWPIDRSTFLHAFNCSSGACTPIYCSQGVCFNPNFGTQPILQQTSSTQFSAYLPLIDWAPTVSITSPANGASFATGSNIVVQATASDTDGQVASVGFYRSTGGNPTLIGTATSAPYQATWSNAQAGTYALTAVATDNQGLQTTSGAVSVTVGNAAPPTLANNGFETPVVGSGNYQYGPTGGSWTFTAAGPYGGSGVSGNGSAFTNQNPNAPFGAQVGFIQGATTIAQTVNFPSAGSYHLTLYAAKRGSNYNGLPLPVNVLIDGAFNAQITPTLTSYQLFRSNAFSVSAGNHTITFQGVNPNGYDITTFLDNVLITSP